MLIDKEFETRKRAQARRKLYMKETNITSAFLKELASCTEFCIYCGVKMQDYGDMYRTKTLDHIKPLSRGGKHMKDNVRYICWLCNNTKRDLFEVDFIAKYLVSGVEITGTVILNGKELRKLIYERFN